MKKLCGECGILFDPDYQGDPDDVRCIDCIDRENADEFRPSKKWIEHQKRRTKMAKFKLGQLVMTRGVNDLVAENEEFAKFALKSLQRHAAGDWGDLDEGDKKENEFALDKYLRIFSAYKKDKWEIWIITEADRSATTTLFPSEY